MWQFQCVRLTSAAPSEIYTGIDLAIAAVGSSKSHCKHEFHWYKSIELRVSGCKL